ncbi:MAG TPA: hypothetical protein PLD54_03695 [Candidatus Levybacteria bacterium]|nr:hypothetical protein [Candidatus Levybacteria bacterium]
MRKIILEDNSKKRKLFKINTVRTIIVLLVLSAITLEGVNIFLNNRMATDSIQASQLKKELAVVVQENNVIKAKVYELSSYESVASRAAELGFKEASSTISLDAPVQVARQ